MLKKIIIIIQARLNSTRLKEKVLLDLCGKTVIEHIYERCKNCKGSGNVIIATSTNPDDDKLANFLKSKNIPYFRGSEKNVLDRFYSAAKKYNSEIIVRVCGDNPLIDYMLIDTLIQKLVESNLDYAAPKNFPLGFGSEVFTFSALEKTYNRAKEKYQLEHVTPYIYENPEIFKISYIVENDAFAINCRLTLDTENDYQLLKHLYDKFYNNAVVDNREVMNYLKLNPKLLKLNSSVNQKSYKECEN